MSGSGLRKKIKRLQKSIQTYKTQIARAESNKAISEVADKIIAKLPLDTHEMQTLMTFSRLVPKLVSYRRSGYPEVIASSIKYLEAHQNDPPPAPKPKNTKIRRVKTAKPAAVVNAGPFPIKITTYVTQDDGSAPVVSVRMVENKLPKAQTKPPKVKPLPPEPVPFWKSPASFYNTEEWKRLRYNALVASDGRCLCCGRSAKEGAVLRVDHIESISSAPHRKADPTNLQVLCNDCNWGKGGKDRTDWRKSPTPKSP